MIAVDGTLEAVESLTIRLPDGSDLTFTPTEDASFHGGPLSHVRDHLTSGLPIEVTYIVLEDGSLAATDVGDG